MQQSIRVIENIKPVWAAPPQNFTGAAMTAKYVSLKNYDRLWIVIQTGAWAAGTAAVSLLQATNVAAAGAKALGLTTMWVSGANPSDTYTKTAVVANTFNLATANLVYIIDVAASDLDVTNGFDCVTLVVATPGANADFYSVMYYGVFPRYPDAALPTMILD